MRGLKLHFSTDEQKEGYVASFTDAWIETVVAAVNTGAVRGRIFYRCVD